MAAVSVGCADLGAGLITRGLTVEEAKCELFDSVTWYCNPSQRQAEDAGVALMSAAAKNRNRTAS